MAEKKQSNKTQLTDRQRRILEVIQDAVSLRGYPPSIREIGDAVGLNSTSSVAYQLKELEKMAPKMKGIGEHHCSQRVCTSATSQF